MAVDKQFQSLGSNTINVVETAPSPTSRTPSFPSAGSMRTPFCPMRISLRRHTSSFYIPYKSRATHVP